MHIDRRITNGLAWAGALLVVGVPAADFVSRQFLRDSAPQVSLVQAPAAPAEPAPAAPATPAPAEPVAPAEAPRQTESTPVAANGGGDAVDRYLQSGRPLPSYITGGGDQAATPAAQPAPATPPATTPPQPAPQAPASTPAAPPAAPAAEEPMVAALPPKVAPVPMPASMRPRPPAAIQSPPVVVQPPAAAQPPLIVETPADYVTAEDLEDWETGPLSDFLASRRAGASGNAVPPEDYDPDGFFLDEGPNSRARYQRFPYAYDDEVYFPSW